MASLQCNTVPMVTVFKNIANILITGGDFFFFGNQSENLVLVAFVIMLSGAVAPAWKNISITVMGIFCMTANCVATASYVLHMKFATQHVKLSKFGMVYVNNVLCVAFLLPAAFLMGELDLFLRLPGVHTQEYFLKYIFAGYLGIFLNFASLSCVAATGPTTYAIVGSVKKVPVAFLGYALFDSIISKETWCYIAVSLCGGFLYSYAKVVSSQKNTTQKKEAK